MIDRGMRVTQPPHHRGKRPEKHLEVGAGKGYPQTFGSLWKQPGIAHVAIKGGLKINQQETNLPHPSAEVFAGEAVGKLVQSHDAEDNAPGEKQGFEVENQS